MEVDMLFKIAAVGIIVAVLNQVLSRSGRDEYTMITTLAGLIIVLMMLIPGLVDLFDRLQSTLFQFKCIFISDKSIFLIDRTVTV